MRRVFTTLVILNSAMLAFLLGGCGTSGGGGGAAAVACPTGTCATGYACVSGYCQYDPGKSGQADAASSTQDTQQSQDVVLPADVPVEPDSAVQDIAAEPDVAAAPDVPDTSSKPDTIKLDTAPDTNKPDGGGDVMAIATTIQDLQQAASSLTCGKPDAIVPYGKFELKSVVLTGPPTKVKGKVDNNLLFFVTPSNGPKSGQYAGIQVLVLGESLSLQAGDVLDVSGEVSEFFCMTEIVVNPSDLQVIGKVAPPLAYVVPLATLQGETAEPYEDVLVQIKNVTVSNPNVLGTDGKPHAQFAIGPSAGSSILAVGLPGGSSYATNSVPSLKTGQFYSSVTGNLTYSFGAWVLRMRTDADLQP